MGLRSKSVVIVLSVLLVACSACSKEKLSELVDKTKQKVSQGADQIKEGVGAVTDTAKEQLHLAGNAQLQLDTPITSSGCYATFTTVDDQRGRVLQIRSYSSLAQESFPSFLLRASVNAAGASELVGQDVPAELFVQIAADGPIHFSAPDTPVQLKIIAVDEKTLTAELVGGSLQNSHRPGELPVTGSLTAVWQ